MPALLASWNPARDAWETSHGHIDLFSGLSAVFSGTWPSSGSMRNGSAYELPTSVPLTDGSASSSSPGLLLTPRASRGAASTENAYLLDGRAKDGALLPTPDAYEASRGGSQHPDKRKDGGHSPYLASVVEWTLLPAANDTSSPAPSAATLTVGGHLLPTPKATDGTKGGPNQRGSSGDLTLPSAAMTLLPTPTATPYGSNQSPSPGAAVRPSLDTLAPMLLPTPTSSDSDQTSAYYQGGNPTLIGALLPTPTVMDSVGSRNCTAQRSPDAKPSSNGTTLTDWLWLHEGWTGDPTDQPSDGGNAA